MEKKIVAPLRTEEIEDLKAGDFVYITGTVYCARDAAHKRMDEALQRGEELPIPLKDQIIYYMGPSPAREGRVIGSAGPTTAGRMDKYTPTLLNLGLKGMIGKGKRTPAVRDTMMKTAQSILRRSEAPARFCPNASKDRSWLLTRILGRKRSGN